MTNSTTSDRFFIFIRNTQDRTEKFSVEDGPKSISSNCVSLIINAGYGDGDEIDDKLLLILFILLGNCTIFSNDNYYKNDTSNVGPIIKHQGFFQLLISQVHYIPSIPSQSPTFDTIDSAIATCASVVAIFTSQNMVNKIIIENPSITDTELSVMISCQNEFRIRDSFNKIIISIMKGIDNILDFIISCLTPFYLSTFIEDISIEFRMVIHFIKITIESSYELFNQCIYSSLYLYGRIGIYYFIDQVKTELINTIYTHLISKGDYFLDFLSIEYDNITSIIEVNFFNYCLDWSTIKINFYNTRSQIREDNKKWWFSNDKIKRHNDDKVPAPRKMKHIPPADNVQNNFKKYLKYKKKYLELIND
jgi:hypothetical protein